MGLAGIRGDLLRPPSETAVNETSESASFPLADLTPFLGGASKECLAQSAAFAEGLARRENWALQSECVLHSSTGLSKIFGARFRE